MDQIRSDEPEGAPACAHNADAGAPSGGAGPERRNSARRKLAAVTRLLRGEPLETVARELNVTVARLSAWRDRALVAAEVAMKERERDSRDEELLRLKPNLNTDFREELDLVVHPLNECDIWRGSDAEP